MALRDAYVVHISNMFQLLGESAANATADAQSVLEFETMIADFTLPPDALVDPFFVYNKIDLSGLAGLSPNIPWNMYLQGLGKQFKQATVDVPPFFSNLSAILPNTQQYWVPYLRWQVVNAFASTLSQAFVDENFNFWGKILNGQEKQSPRDETCIRFTDNALGELLGSFFLDQAFPGESRQMATGILQEIEAAMQADIEQIEWMDNTTRQRALQKLSLVSNMIGGPENPRNYSDVTVNPDTFFENVVSANIFMMQTQLDQIEQPADKDLWGMTPPTVNAYYDPTRNQMVFPAGILQQPFFNVSFPKAMNHGGVGMVMGHELTHGFDNQGRDYDGTGRLTNWWLPATSSKFDQKVQCVIQQYSQFEVLPNVYVNGKLTQGENIADMGGIKNSYNAFKTVIGNQADAPSIVPGLTNMELFFVAFAQGWCEKATDEALKNQVETNPHSPAKFRVLGPLINLPEFSDTFKCAQGTPMNPTSRCQVW
jgi:putative endopeptidase